MINHVKVCKSAQRQFHANSAHSLHIMYRLNLTEPYSYVYNILPQESTGLRIVFRLFFETRRLGYDRKASQKQRPYEQPLRVDCCILGDREEA